MLEAQKGIAVPHEHVVHLVDPDESIGEALSLLLGTYGIIVRSYSDAESFLQAYQAGQAQNGCLLIADNLPGENGLCSVRALREHGFSLPVIVITGSINAGFRTRALQMGATEVLEKPLMDGLLIEKLGTLLPGATGLTDSVASGFRLSDGTLVTFRVMRPEDAEMEKSFITKLSAQSRHSRFFSNIKQLSAKMLEQFTHPNYPESYALMATINNGDREQQIGVARYMPTDTQGAAEFAVVVADEWQGQGVATVLLRGLTTAAAIAGIRRLQGLVLHDNTAMRRLAQAQGFSSTRCSRDASMFSIAKCLNFVGDAKE
tara:strand:+ start:101831 stop:102781 length:951 start_codon:yes stop_codon:yes gene_type:complete